MLVSLGCKSFRGCGGCFWLGQINRLVTLGSGWDRYAGAFIDLVDFVVLLYKYSFELHK